MPSGHFEQPATRAKTTTKRNFFMKTTLLIDGDVLVYQIGLACEVEIDWGDDWWTLHADAKEAKASLDAKINAFLAKLDADSARIALSCPTDDGYRRALCPTYKSNRADKRKPVVHKALRQHVIDNYDAILRPQLEADDILGILATQPLKNETRIIVSVDKDFRGVPCNLYRTNEPNPSVERVTTDAALRFFYKQVLMGDRVDGYAGIPGVGPATADKILDGVPTAKLWPAVRKAYKDAGLAESVAIQTARLARILQHGDYDTKTGAINLWLPPKK